MKQYILSPLHSLTIWAIVLLSCLLMPGCSGQCTSGPTAKFVGDGITKARDCLIVTLAELPACKDKPCVIGVALTLLACIAAHPENAPIPPDAPPLSISPSVSQMSQRSSCPHYYSLPSSSMLRSSAVQSLSWRAPLQL